MRLLFTAFGSAGDVVPILAVAQAAIERGHDCLALLNPKQLGLAEARRVSAEPFGTPWTTAAFNENRHWLHPSRGSIAMLREVMAPRTAQLFPALQDACDRFDPSAIVHHQASFGVAWVARPRNIPRVCVTVAPAGWPSVDNPNLYPPMPDRERYPAWTIKLGSVFGRRAVNHAIDPVLNSIRKDHGLPPASAFMFEEQPGDLLNIGMWSPHYRSPAQDDPPSAFVAGFPCAVTDSVGDDQHASANLARFEAWRDERRDPPIAISLGTTASYSGIDQAGLAEALHKQTGRRVVVLAGGDSADTRASGGVLLLGFVPHGLVLPRCHAVVHHGGIGTVAQTLRAGALSITTPFTHDQPDNARRLRRLGLGATLKPRQLNADRIAAALDQLESSGAEDRVAAFARSIADEDGGANTVEAIESRLAARTPSSTLNG